MRGAEHRGAIFAAPEGRVNTALLACAAAGDRPARATAACAHLSCRDVARRTARLGGRHVRFVVLTNRGARVRAAILRAFHEPPFALLAVDRRDEWPERGLLSLASPAGRC